MPTDAENVRLSGRTESGWPTVKVTQIPYSDIRASGMARRYGLINALQIIDLGAFLTDPRVERRLVTVLAQDIAGHSRLMGADEEGTLAQIPE